ncbi:putative leader peptide [Kineococcus gypseus]
MNRTAQQSPLRPLLSVQRRHVDLCRVGSALCRRTRA